MSEEQFATTMLEILLKPYGVLNGVIYQFFNVTPDLVEDRIVAEWERLGMLGLNVDASAVEDRELLAKIQSPSRTERPTEKFRCNEQPSANSQNVKGCFARKRKAKVAKDENWSHPTSLLPEVQEGSHVTV